MTLLVVSPRMTADVLARESGVHPELVVRLVGMGLIDEPFTADQPAQLARAVRLRRDLGLNWAGALLACELLARIDELEERLARVQPRRTRR